VVRMPSWSSGSVHGERPERPFTGYKLANAVLSADGARAGFVGLTLGATEVYGVTAEARCVWNSHHVPPRRWCGCGFYCLHALGDALALGCATENRSAVLLEVAAAGRYIRYERGLRYSRQRVRVIRESRCDCGLPGSALAEAGSGLIGWRHLVPVCGHCAAGRPLLTMREFAARLDGPVRVEAPEIRVPAASAPEGGVVEGGVVKGGVVESGVVESGVPKDGATAGESQFAVLAAEIALLHARLDDLQSRLGR
jgi:hypothetical protein